MIWVREHAGLLVSSLAVLTVVTKLWAVSHGDPVTIAGLLSAEGPVSLALAALIVGLPAFSTIPLFAAGVWLMEAIREGTPVGLHLVVVAASALLALMLAPVRVMLFVAGVVAAGAAISILLRVLRRFGFMAESHLALIRASASQEDIELQPTPARMLAGIAVALAWLALAFSDAPWYEPERVDTRHGIEVGYVVEESPDEITLLRRSDRQLITISSGDLRSRSRCRAGSWQSESAIARLSWRERPAYPRC